jgi:hypothetical protein
MEGFFEAMMELEYDIQFELVVLRDVNIVTLNYVIGISK